MRQYTLITALILLLGSGCTRAPGRLAFEPAEIDVRSDALGAEQDVSFTLRNVGGAPLEIDEVKPSCSCTTIVDALHTVQLPAGAKVAVKLRVSPPVYGKTDVMIVARAASPDVPPAVALLRLHGSSSVPALFTTTRRVEMTGAAPWEELIGVVELSTDEKAKDDPWVTGLVSTSPDVTTELIERKIEKTLSDDVVRCAYVFVVRGTAPAAGESTSSLKLRISPASGGTAAALPEIGVTLRCAPALRAVPGELVARRRDGNAPAECRLAIVADDDASFEVTSAADADWYTVVNQDDVFRVAANRHTLVLAIDTEKCATKPGEPVRKILLTTTHPKVHELSVPVRVLVE